VATLKPKQVAVFTEIRTYHTPMLKQVYDGILFCAASALGFATIENIFWGYPFNRTWGIL
jgi:RsiW-degrading membrane proteinase PrsW (M82 family)